VVQAILKRHTSIDNSLSQISNNTRSKTEPVMPINQLIESSVRETQDLLLEMQQKANKNLRNVLELVSQNQNSSNNLQALGSGNSQIGS
jgi:Mg2+ and Co2+ transporter CorA